INICLADGEIISSIGKGLCILIGISRDDTQKDIDYL
ncbi:D-aminoacyl-tRNA deacylase 1-like, partial [Homalodisca vitripennis]